MSFIQEAFNQICNRAEAPREWYVCLMESVPYYGGPEEGGWWGRDVLCVAYQAFATLEAAEAVRAKVGALAATLATQSLREHGDRCLQELEWLEARGLPADWLPEPDGPSEYSVIVSESVPMNSRGCREYS